MKKIISVMLGLLVMAFATVCFAAESYQMTYEAKNFTEELKNNQALSETFTTPYGALKLQMRKLCGQEGCLQFVQSAVISLVDMMILEVRAVISQCPDSLRKHAIVGDHRAGIAESPKVFPGVKAESRNIPECSDFSSLISRAVRLCTIFYNMQAMLPGDFQNRVHLTSLSIEVDRHNCFRSV